MSQQTAVRARVLFPVVLSAGLLVPLFFMPPRVAVGAETIASEQSILKDPLLSPLAPSVASTPTFTPRYFGDPYISSQSISIGDVNGDGALDLVKGIRGQQSVVYLNDGHGGFGGAGMPIGGANNTRSIVLGDMNGDGALDIVQGNYQQPSVIYLNDGHGGSGTSMAFGDAYFSTSIMLGSVNGDGTLDIVQPIG
jgi:hypothetical protein